MLCRIWTHICHPPGTKTRRWETRLRDVEHCCLWLGNAGHLSASSLPCLFRIEAYHRLRSVLAQVSERKELIGHTDLDVAISNEYGCLVANIVIAYNSILLSGY
jgi:hypothetical protein